MCEINKEKKEFIKLQGKIKKFDEKLYEKYDVPARNLIKQIFGSSVKDNPDIYKEDMLIDIDKCKYKFLELQVCATWTCEYPHKNVFIYERKAHFSENTIYILFNKHMTEGFLFDKGAILMTPKRIKKYSKTFIYEINWNKIIPFYTKDLNSELIELCQHMHLFN